MNYISVSTLAKQEKIFGISCNLSKCSTLYKTKICLIFFIKNSFKLVRFCLSSECFFDTEQLSFELAQFRQTYIDALLLYRTVWSSNLENKSCARLAYVFAVSGRDLVTKNHLKVGQLLQSHQTGDRVEWMCFLSFSINGCSECFHSLGLLNRTARCNLFDERCFGGFSVFRYICGEVCYDESFESVGDSFNFFIAPADAFIFELTSYCLSAQLALCFSPVGDLSRNLCY